LIANASSGASRLALDTALAQSSQQKLACVRGQQNRSCKKWLTASWSDPVATFADAGGGKLAAFGSFCVPAAFPGLDL